MKTIHILGGGISGLSAAHELARMKTEHKVDLEVHVYDKEGVWGGKAVSQWPKHSGSVLPGEHGFRFFPHFYRCIVATMGEIPISEAYAAANGLRPSSDGTVRGLLRNSTHAGFAVNGRLFSVEREGADPLDVVALLARGLEIETRDILPYLRILLRFATSCQGRQFAEYEHRTLAEVFKVDGGTFSPGFKRYLRSIRALSAMRTDVGSARTGLHGSLQLMANFDPESNNGIDQVLVGPTDVTFLRPWVQHLKTQGVCFHPKEEVTALHIEDHALKHADLRHTDSGEYRRVGDDDDEYVICAVPIEVMKPLVRAAASGNSALDSMLQIEQDTEFMVGCQYYLKRPFPADKLEGHIAYVNSPWALTSINQEHLWKHGLLNPLSEHFNVDELNGVLSVIISAWDVKGSKGKTALECSAEELLDEVWLQMASDLGADWPFRGEDVLARHMDDNMRFPAGGEAYCTTPLFVSPAGSYMQRPPSDCGIARLYLAGDYVRNETDLATMEGANESARRAVAAMGRAWGVAPECLPVIPPLRVPKPIGVAQQADAWLHGLGLPHVFDLLPSDVLALWRRLRGAEGMLEQAPPTSLDELIEREPEGIVGGRGDYLRWVAVAVRRLVSVGWDLEGLRAARDWFYEGG